MSLPVELDRTDEAEGRDSARSSESLPFYLSTSGSVQIFLNTAINKTKAEAKFFVSGYLAELRYDPLHAEWPSDSHDSKCGTRRNSSRR
jgi:hypothetical protein